MVGFQPRTLTTPDLSSVAYCYAHLLNPPHPPLIPSSVPYNHPYSSVLPPHRIIRPPGRHPSTSQNTEKTPSPSLPSPVTTRARLLLSYLSLTMPDRFLFLPLPHCSRNLFYRGLQLPYLRRLLPPLLAQQPPYLVSGILRTDLEYCP